MATPANNEPIPTLFSSLLPAVDLSDSSTDDISLIDATDVCSDKETRKLKGVSNRTEVQYSIVHTVQYSILYCIVAILVSSSFVY